jgi:hypothetical protein
MGDERRDDWHHDVDESLVSLNAAQRITDRLLEDLDENYSALDRLLRGDTEKETDGLIGRFRVLERQISELNSVIFMDRAGDKGLWHDVKELKNKREDRRLGWKNITKVIVALVMSGLLGALGHFWNDIYDYLNRKDTDPVDQAVEKAKRPRIKGRKVLFRQVPRDQTPDP